MDQRFNIDLFQLYCDQKAWIDLNNNHDQEQLVDSDASAHKQTNELSADLWHQLNDDEDGAWRQGRADQSEDELLQFVTWNNLESAEETENTKNTTVHLRVRTLHIQYNLLSDWEENIFSSTLHLFTEAVFKAFTSLLLNKVLMFLNSFMVISSSHYISVIMTSLPVCVCFIIKLIQPVLSEILLWELRQSFTLFFYR